jgi:thiosulfate/3-mercaptopyruvate sulfurtransferase
MSALRRPLIDPAAAVELCGRADVVFADVRWYLDGRDGRAAYEAGHIAGAIFVDMDTVLADHAQPATAGRHPLPSAEAFARALGDLGIGDNTTVIAYDDSGGGTAGRLVFMLRVIGHDAALLDGGLRAWSGPTASGPAPVLPVRQRNAVAWPADRFATIDEMRSRAVAMYDARAGDRYRGDSEPIDRIGGHIPGAQSAPWSRNLDPATSRFRDPDELAELWGGEPEREIVCYCGSGVSACANLIALEHAGFTKTKLFVASWSGWSADGSNPVATGDEPG